MKRPLFTLAFILPIVMTFAQSNYYVDHDNGNDNNTGTSFDKAWKSIQKACNSATPGSTVFIDGGTYHENIYMNVGGSIKNPITFKNYMNENVIIDGSGTTGSTLLTIEDKSYLIFQNLTFQNLTKNNAQGILIECSSSGNVDSITFNNIVVRNINWTANANTIPSDNDNSQGLIAYGRGTTADNAIHGITIENCEFYDNITGFSEVISLDGNIDGFVMRNNKVHHNTNIGIYAGGNYGECSVASLDHARNGVIENNICYKNISKYATSGGIYVDGAYNVVVSRNTCYSNGFGIEIGCEEDGTTENISVINNLIYRNLDGGMFIGGYTTQTTGQVLNCTIRNNTLFENDSSKNGSGEFYITKASDCQFLNNIMYTNDENVLLSVENIAPQSGLSFNYNLWYTPNNDAEDINVDWRGNYYSSFSDYISETGQDGNSYYENPNFTNPDINDPDFHVSSSSKCINSGDPATQILLNETDFDGNPRISLPAIDIGAYEYDITANLSSRVKNTASYTFIPNPFTSTTVIEPSLSLNNASLMIFTTDGKQLLKKEHISGNNFSLEKGSIPKGLYIYMIVQEKNRITGKLIIE